MFRYVAVAIVFLLIGGLAAMAAKRPPGLSRVTCYVYGDEVGAKGFLAVGDSWANGEFVRGLAHEFNRRHQHAGIKVCGISYPGSMTSAVYERAANDLSPERIREMFANGGPAAAVLVVGLNDVAGHAGGRAYAQGARRLYEHFAQIEHRVVVAIPSVSGSGKERLSAGAIRRWFLRQWHNESLQQTAARYRQALIRRCPDVRTLDPDQFLGSAEAQYTPDGMHLTPASFVAFGAFVAHHAAID